MEFLSDENDIEEFSREEEQPETEQKSRLDSLPPYLYQRKPMAAFWTVASIISLTVNVILILVLVVLGQQLFTLKGIVTEKLLAGLYYNFLLMDQAHIVTEINVVDTIQVVDTIPVVFDLPLEQATEVVLVRDTPIDDATIVLNNQPVPLDLTLRKGTPLNISLDLVVPVSQTIPVVLNVPVNLKVPVDIPLQETDLHGPFTGLQDVVSPYFWPLVAAPDRWEDVPLCQDVLRPICDWILIPE